VKKKTIGSGMNHNDILLHTDHTPCSIVLWVCVMVVVFLCLLNINLVDCLFL
jgi:hypothetical protein